MNQQEVHKALVRDFYRQAIGQRDVERVHQLVADNYIQHNPLLRTGKAGVLDALAYLKKLPPLPEAMPPVLRMLAEDEYVAVHFSIQIGTQRQAVVDLFRLRNGQLVEHWDAIQTQPDTTQNGHSMTDGPIEPGDREATALNKTIAETFFRYAFVERQPERLSDLVAPDLIQHNPAIGNGRAGLLAYLRTSAADISVTGLHQVVGEGNLVLIQASGQWHQQPAVFYTLLRLAEQKIAEQWSVQQLIPEKMAHTNGMI